MLCVITGPMFSGKTTELIAKIESTPEDRHAVIYKHHSDNRYDDTMIVSHAGVKREAVAVVSMDNTVFTHDNMIFYIDEAQFFGDDIVNFAKRARAAGHDVYVAGLDLDSEAHGFGPMPKLIKLADILIKKTAICTCGEPAAYTKRMRPGKLIEVGGADLYVPTCGDCFCKK